MWKRIHLFLCFFSGFECRCIDPSVRASFMWFLSYKKILHIGSIPEECIAFGGESENNCWTIKRRAKRISLGFSLPWPWIVRNCCTWQCQLHTHGGDSTANTTTTRIDPQCLFVGCVSVGLLFLNPKMESIIIRVRSRIDLSLNEYFEWDWLTCRWCMEVNTEIQAFLCSHN